MSRSLRKRAVVTGVLLIATAMMAMFAMNLREGSRRDRELHGNASYMYCGFIYMNRLLNEPWPGSSIEGRCRPLVADAPAGFIDYQLDLALAGCIDMHDAVTN